MDVQKYYQLINILDDECELEEKGFLHNLGKSWCHAHNYEIPENTVPLSKRWFRSAYLCHLFLNFDKTKYYLGTGNSTYLSKIGAELLKADQAYRAVKREKNSQIKEIRKLKSICQSRDAEIKQLNNQYDQDFFKFDIAMVFVVIFVMILLGMMNSCGCDFI
jgi:hypothetical protein